MNRVIRARIANAQQDLTNAQLAQAYAPSVSQKIIDNWKRDVLAEDQAVGCTATTSPSASCLSLIAKAMEWQKDNPWFGV
jgi:hypothetical protein